MRSISTAIDYNMGNDNYNNWCCLVSIASSVTLLQTLAGIMPVACSLTSPRLRPAGLKDKAIYTSLLKKCDDKLN